MKLWILQDFKGTKWNAYRIKISSNFNHTILGSLPDCDILFSSINDNPCLIRGHSLNSNTKGKDKFLVEKIRVSEVLMMERSHANNSVRVCCLKEKIKTLN